jgi:hypothetical protein
MTLSIHPLSSFVLTCPLLVLLHSFYLGAARTPLSCRQRWPGRERPSLLRRWLVLRSCLLLSLLLGKPLRPAMVQPSVSGRRRIGLLWQNGRHQSGSLGRRRSIWQRLLLLVLTLRVLRGELPSLRASLRWSVGPRKRLRGNTEHVLRSSPSYRLRTLSYVTPLSALLGHDICLRGCSTQPSNILRWPRSLLCFRLRCRLSWSRCSGAHPTILPAWRW